MYRYVALLLTFVAYACYHALKKPSSIVKSILDLEPWRASLMTVYPTYSWPLGYVFVREGNLSRVHGKGWEPFKGKDGMAKLGETDVAFLAYYSLGIGPLHAASVLQYGWGWSLILPGALIFFGGIMVYLLLAAYPEDVGIYCPHGLDTHTPENGSKDEEVNAMPQVGSMTRSNVVGLMEASIGGEYVSVKSTGNLYTLFDVGGIVGGILVGYIYDKLSTRATTAGTFMYARFPRNSFFLFAAVPL
ncbi:hypothetical protein GIB67_026403 [Kingdonia uniflora]|uniref:Uncharacterized protein n=1 Tax=Kingdonia uniflora TaxID=39325 RepID=A0A7J7P649_9MAGN|nr:hypothetical protein GIB67_026403 [Kingdonia uniflora]